jgi:glycosyltransferase involved in cell wall biosynthesis
VLGQTLPPGDVIVADDGSSDKSAEIAEGFGDKVRVLRLRHRGSAAALNSARSVAKGDMIAFNDADDLWTPDKLAFQTQLLAADLKLEAVFGSVINFNDPDYTISAPGDIRPGGRALVGATKNAMLIRRSAFDRVGPFDETMAVSDFAEWYPRAIRSGVRTHFPDRVVVFRRIHRTNATRLLRQELHRDYLRIAREAIESRAAGPVE